MYKILKNEKISNNIYLLSVYAPLIVKRCLPGQFLIVMCKETSERIPLTIYDYNKAEGIVSMIYSVVGESTIELSQENCELFSIVGPLGNPSVLIENINETKSKKVLFIAGGVGIAPVYPQAKYLYENGIDVDIIYGARSKESIIIEDKVKSVCNNLYIVTDDGSYGKKGLVTDCLKELDKRYDICVAIGPVVMMKYVSMLTKEMNLATIVSMNPIMVDGTGMCGACRLNVGGSIKFACVDGPEFDGHLVDFDAAIKRMNIYKTEEGRNKLRALEGNTHHGGCGNCGDHNE